MQRDILCLNIASFAAQVEQRSQPSLKAKPVIIGKPKGNTSGVVVSASKEARKHGVTEDMSLRQALRICPDAAIIQADFAVYRQVFNDFLQICSHYTPLIEPDMLGCAWMDVTGSRSLFGQPFDIASRITRRVSDQLGLTLSVGCASNKLIARIASNSGRKFTRVMPGGEPEFLSRLPVSVLDAVDEKVAKRLGELGILTVGQLAQIPEAMLARQFGSVGSIIKRQALGKDFTSVKAAYPPEVITAERMCDQALSEPTEVEQYMSMLVDKTVAHLKKHNTLAGEVMLTIFNESGAGPPRPIPAYLKFKKPTRSASMIMQALCKLLASKMEPGMEVSGIRIEFSELAHEESRQLAFVENCHTKERLNKTVELVKSRFGDGAVRYGSSFLPAARGQFFSESPSGGCPPASIRNQYGCKQ
jgi:DNA polymerase-4